MTSRRCGLLTRRDPTCRLTHSLVGGDDDIRALGGALVCSCMVTITGVRGERQDAGLRSTPLRRRYPSFPGGVWLVSLANLDSAEPVSDVVLTAVGGRRQPGRSALFCLAELANSRRLLVVLDNCEHVLDAAAECAEAIVADGDSVRYSPPVVSPWR